MAKTMVFMSSIGMDLRIMAFVPSLESAATKDVRSEREREHGVL